MNAGNRQRRDQHSDAAQHEHGASQSKHPPHHNEPTALLQTVTAATATQISLLLFFDPSTQFPGNEKKLH